MPISLSPRVRLRSGLAAWSTLMLSLLGCVGSRYHPPTTPMPPNTVLLSTTMQRLSATPGFTEALLARLNTGSRNGPALLTPKLFDQLRKLILGQDWGGLDRFPGWTMGEISPTVRVAEHLLPGLSGRTSPAADTEPNLSRQPSAAEVGAYLNLGSFPLDQAADVDLTQAVTSPVFHSDQQDLGNGVVSGDGPDPRLAPEHAASLRLAQLLNRLSVNGLTLDGPEDGRRVTVALGSTVAASPAELIRNLQQTGHTVVVRDARYFANFGHLHDEGRDVMMPFWVDTRLRVPGTLRPLLIPVSHAEYEWQVRGPHVNADVAFYFGIDGHAEFRTMDELNQPWVLGRFAHQYTGNDAVEVTRLTAAFLVAYVHQHVARPKLPFGGYYTLGVCQDAVSAIEQRMTGHNTLYPNTAQTDLFDDTRDAEVNALLRALPIDRRGKAPQPERVFGSLPTTNLEAITIPGLRDDIVRSEQAWRQGSLHHLPRHRHWLLELALEITGGVLAIALIGWLARRPRPRRRA